jgi:hypothetical protein
MKIRSDRKSPHDSIIHIYKMYVLSTLIVGQSADVGRCFFMLVQSLGLERLLAHTKTLDARLHIKQLQARPTKPSRDDLQALGALQFMGADKSDEFDTVSSQV